MNFVQALGDLLVQTESRLAIGLTLAALVSARLLFSNKIRVSLWSFVYMALSKDKTFNSPKHRTFIPGRDDKRKTVIFLRHGESKWNIIFNKGWKLFLPFKLAIALIKELLMIFSEDSLFIDSALSDFGVQQALDLSASLCSNPSVVVSKNIADKPVKELTKEELIAIVQGKAGQSIVVSSALRRAVSTAALALKGRFEVSVAEKIIILDALQEVSRNVDTNSLAAPYTKPPMVPSEIKRKDVGDYMNHFYAACVDERKFTGNKGLSKRGKERHMDFITYLFKEGTPSVVIVSGHSIWFREFIKSFLPASSKHEARARKIVNCGLVAFDLYSSTQDFFIDESSIKVVSGGFEEKFSLGRKKKEA